MTPNRGISHSGPLYSLPVLGKSPTFKEQEKNKYKKTISVGCLEEIVKMTERPFASVAQLNHMFPHFRGQLFFINFFMLWFGKTP